MGQPAGLLVRVIGELAVTRAGVAAGGTSLGSRKGRTLLALLAVQRDRLLDLDRIVEVLWGDAPPAQPAENIATLVSRLRRDFGSELITGGRAGYRLGGPPAVLVDLDQAAHWVQEAERRGWEQEPALAVAAAVRAKELLTAGLPLAGEPWAEWVQPARAEHAALLTRLRHVLADAAVVVGDHQLAQATATAAITDDPYDERAVRAAMRAHVGAGEPARALALYADLRERLADELGTDPSAETEALHLALLRSETPAAGNIPPPRRTAEETVGLVGRAAELQRLREAWNDAAAGRPALVVVVGEAGIGKSRLCEELLRIGAATGGTVVSARCYDTERSLFLQPMVEAVGALARSLPPAVFRDAAGEYAETLSGLVPEAAAVLGPAPVRRRGTAEMERRRAFEAAGGFLRTLADRGPVLVGLDDLHNSGRSTVEFLHYLRRRLGRGRLLVVATVRAEEGGELLDSLAEVADRLDLGPLSRSAVTALATAAGLADRATDIARRTGGHTLYVVETLRALAAGTDGLPPSLEAAVSARVARAGRSVEEVLRAAAVLGAAFEPATLSRLLGTPLQTVAAACTDALAARLLVVAGRDYEFAHDLVREVLYSSTPWPTRRAYHLLAADLLTDRPEAMAAHAAAAEDWPRAARAFLLAGEQALARAAAGDAVQLLGRCLAAVDSAGELEDVRARALLGRGRAHAAQPDYRAALADIEAATEAARAGGDQRLEILALRELGGEVPTALGRSVVDCIRIVERGLAVATSVADRTLQAHVESWLAILAANGLRFAEAVEHGQHALQTARAGSDQDALAAALDGRKTSLAYLGEVHELQPVIDELEPLLRRSGDLFRLHWAVFESAFPAVARGEWTQAEERIRAALEVQRRSGYSAYAGWHVAHLGWLARMQGRYEEATEIGRRAVALCEDAPHVWCAATAGAQLGVTLLERGETDAAVRVLEQAWDTARHGADAYRLRCAAPLAEATRDREMLAAADALLAGITAPAGSAYLVGDWCYLAVARAWLGLGEPARARAVLAPLLLAARRIPWVGALAGATLVDGRAAAMLGLATEAERQLRRAGKLAERYRLSGVARELAGTPVG